MSSTSACTAACSLLHRTACCFLDSPLSSSWKAWRPCSSAGDQGKPMRRRGDPAVSQKFVAALRTERPMATKHAYIASASSKKVQRALTGPGVASADGAGPEALALRAAPRGMVVCTCCLSVSLLVHHHAHHAKGQPSKCNISAAARRTRPSHSTVVSNNTRPWLTWLTVPWPFLQVRTQVLPPWGMLAEACSSSWRRPPCPTGQWCGA